MEDKWSWVIWIVVLLTAIVAIRGTIRFDINEWSRDRRKQKEENLRALCPHVMIMIDGNSNEVIDTMFISPFGSVQWQCQNCGMVCDHESRVRDILNYWISNPKKLKKRYRKIYKLSKKLGRE